LFYFQYKQNRHIIVLNGIGRAETFFGSVQHIFYQSGTKLYMGHMILKTFINKEIQL